MHRSLRALLIAGVASVLVPATGAAQSPITFSNETGTTTVSLGTLIQPQLDWERRDNADDAASVALRRVRFIAGGRVFGKLKFFVETDSPNFGVHRNRTFEREIYLQDIILTYEVRPEVQVEAGLLMVPVSYNSTQSAASLLGVSYGPYSFLASTPTTSKVGRDYGAQVRGYVAGGHVEYRLGMFEGVRELDRSAPARVAGRLVWYPFDGQNGFFYTGSTLGKKRTLALGTSFDQQGDYHARAIDAFFDWPVGHGNAVTLQGDLIHYDGGARMPTLKRQNAWLVEGGYYFGALKLGAFGQFAVRDVWTAGAADATAYQAGVMYWLRGHKLNVKVGVGQTRTDGQPARTQLVVQTQLFAY